MGDEKEEPEYDGPFIEQRIEWKCPDRKRHNVVLFGSWNRFKGGDELEYQGKQVFATTVKLPLGNYVYRFLIDGEEWETNNATAKTVRDGIEYNTIHVRQDDESSEEEEDEEEDANASKSNLKAPQNAMQKQTSRVIFDEKKGGFLVAQAPVGKKKRGRPSMELDLGRNFEDEEEEADEDEPKKDESDTAKKDGKETKKKRRRKKKAPPKDIQQEKEWARYVFVQQLRQQQQHNDEINRVKTLWKQERQVRVEMHKKVVKNFKQEKKKSQQLESEIINLKKQLDIRAGGDKKRVLELEKQNEDLKNEMSNIRKKERDLQDEINEIKKTNFEKSKERDSTNEEVVKERKKYEREIEELKTEIKSLKSRNENLLGNIDKIKTGNNETMDYQQKQFEERQLLLEQERKEKDGLKNEIKELKQEKKELLTLKEKLDEENKGEKKKYNDLLKKNKKTIEKTKTLEKEISELKTNNKEVEKFKLEISKITKEKDDEISKILEQKKYIEKRLDDNKNEFEKTIESLKKKQAEDMSAITANNNSKEKEYINKMKSDIDNKDKLISQLKNDISTLEQNINEEKSNFQSSNNKIKELQSELENIKKEKEGLTNEINQKNDELNALKVSQENNETNNKELTNKINELNNEINELKTKLENEEKRYEEKIKNYDERIGELKKLIDDKGVETLGVTKELTEIKQKYDLLTNEKNELGSKVELLEKQLSEEQESSTNEINKMKSEIEKLNSESHFLIEKYQKERREIEDELEAKKEELTKKISDFANSELIIKELNLKIESEKEKLIVMEKDFTEQIKLEQSKGEKVGKLCKVLLTKFTEIKKQMKEIKTEQIEQLEELQQFFDDFNDLLPKVFKFNQAMIDDLLNKYKRELSLRRKYFNMVQDLRGNIRVFCRVRPILPFEMKKDPPATSCLKFPQDGKIVLTDEKNAVHSFEFDQVYKPGTSQEAVSEDSTEYIQSVMDGYNVSIFAYGQTGSGKTFTMDGSKDDPGVNLRGLKHLFKLAEERKPQFQYKIKVAIFEIYNKEIRDLLEQAKEKKKKKKKEKPKDYLKVKHLPDGSVDIVGLSWMPVKGEKDVSELADAAKSQRTAGVTDMNAHSSRSHMMLVVDVSGVNIPANISYQGRLYLVDLAGSERVKKSGAQGQALKEAQNINASLSALGNVISALQRKEKFIPYRDSTLTSVMAPAIGGNAKTIMFLNCCPTASHAFETLSSLKFGLRVGKVELGQAKQQKSKKKDKK